MLTPLVEVLFISSQVSADERLLLLRPYTVALSFFFENAGSQPSVTTLNAGSQPSVTSLNQQHHTHSLINYAKEEPISCDHTQLLALASKATNFMSNVDKELPKWALLESSLAAQSNYEAHIKS